MARACRASRLSVGDWGTAEGAPAHGGRAGRGCGLGLPAARGWGVAGGPVGKGPPGGDPRRFSKGGGRSTTSRRGFLSPRGAPPPAGRLPPRAVWVACAARVHPLQGQPGSS